MISFNISAPFIEIFHAAAIFWDVDPVSYLHFIDVQCDCNLLFTFGV